MDLIIDIGKILFGVLIGLIIKVAIDPILKKRERTKKRKEMWLQDALRHIEEVLRHMQATRHIATLEGGLLHPEQIAETIVRTLTPEYGPHKLQVVENLGLDKIKKHFAKVEEAYRAIRIVDMDLTHGAPHASEEYVPEYAVQRYITQLMDFKSEASRILVGK